MPSLQPSRPLRAAIVGAGFIGAVHARAVRLAGARVVGVGAATRAEAQEAGAAWGADRTYADPAEVAADPEVDVVHVCTPNALHEPYATAALEAGKHVVCEKPLGLDLAEARRLGDRARAAGVVATVPFAYRFHPMVRELRARVRDGQLGAIRLIHGSYLQDWLADEEAENWRTDAAVGGASRAFADIGSHWCDLMEFVTGDRIVGLGARLVTGTRSSTEDAALMQFETAAGAVGSMLVSQVSRGHDNHLVLEVDGGRGSARFDQERPDALDFSDASGSHVLHRGAATMSPAAAALNLLPPGHPQGFNDAFGLFVAHTYDAIRGDARDGLPTFEDGVRAAVLVDAVLASARSGAWTTVADADRRVYEDPGVVDAQPAA